MINLNNLNTSFIILSSTDIENLKSSLYIKNYQITPIRGYFKGEYEDSVIAYNNTDNESLRKDAIQMIDQFDQEYVIIKYKGEPNAKKILPDGSEIPMTSALYNTPDDNNKSYLYDGTSFSFMETKKYWKPSKKEDFKIGMLVEYFNNNEWHTNEVTNPDEEYEKLYKLLIKYDKIRIFTN